MLSTIKTTALHQILLLTVTFQYLRFCCIFRQKLSGLYFLSKQSVIQPILSLSESSFPRVPVTAAYIKFTIGTSQIFITTLSKIISESNILFRIKRSIRNKQNLMNQII